MTARPVACIAMLSGTLGLFGAAGLAGAIQEDGGSAATDAIEGPTPELVATLRDRVRALEQELAEEQALRHQREEEWLEYTRVLQAFDLPELPEAPDFVEEALRPSAEELEAERLARAELERRQARGIEMRRILAARLAAEQHFELDLIEVGLPSVHEGRGVVGPVVARLVDGRGRLVGSLAAERMRLETSRAARTVTLVFEDGYEARGGVRTPFVGATDDAGRGGTRRVFLGSADVDAWVDGLPELVDAEALRALVDDGLWDVANLRRRLDGLLRDGLALAPQRQGARPGPIWRARALGGVTGSTLRDVHLVQQDPEGAVLRRLFADRARVLLAERGVEVVLEDGTFERAGRRAPFLGGRYRLVLPHADAEAWREARIPGLAAPIAPDSLPSAAPAAESPPAAAVDEGSSEDG